MEKYLVCYEDVLGVDFRGAGIGADFGTDGNPDASTAASSAS